VLRNFSGRLRRALPCISKKLLRGPEKQLCGIHKGDYISPKSFELLLHSFKRLYFEMDLSDLALLSLASTTRHDDNAPSDADVKTKKRRVTKACVPCNQAHVSCEKGKQEPSSDLTKKTARPCKRCVERGHPDSCIDKETKRRGRKTTSPTTIQPAVAPAPTHG
jgi:hypothetical protein